MPYATRNVSDFMGDHMDVLMFGAVRDGVTDCLAAFNAAVTSLPRGGRLEIPPGKYALSGPWVIDKPLVIAGQGDGYDEDTAPTCLQFAAGSSGITLPANSAERSVIRDMFIVSLSTAAGTDVGISNASNGVTVKNVTIKNFGSHGLVTDTTSAGNANSSTYEHVRAFANRGHGFYFTGIDSNQIKCTSCSSARNLGWGFYNTRVPAATFTFNNTFDNCHTETNTLGCFYENGSDSVYNNCYAEPDGPVGVCNVSGVTVTRVSGQAFAAEWKGIALQLGGTGYGTVVATVTAPDTLTLASAPGDATGTAFMIRINQRAELGSSAQYSTWFSGTTYLNAPFVVPLNVGFYGGTDNGTHMVTQFGRFLKRLNVRGANPTANIEDTTINPSGVCDTSGTAVTRVSGSAFTADAIRSVIVINGADKIVASVESADGLTLTTSAGAQTGVAFTVELSRVFEWSNGTYALGSLALADINLAEYILAYQPVVGWVMFHPFSIQAIRPIFRFTDMTPTTGRNYSFRNGFSGAGMFSIYDETASEDILIYNGVTDLWTLPKPLKITGGAETTSAVENEPVLGGLGGSPQAGTLSWGGSSGWCFDFGTRVTGAFSRRFRFTDRGVLILRYDAQILDGAGSPEGAVTAPIGSIYLRTDGSANTTLYVKESGASTTGWKPMVTYSLPDQGGHAGQFLKTNATAADWAAITPADFGSQTQKRFLAAPNAADGDPSFRAIAASDVPTLNQNTSGTAAGLSATLAVGSGGTGLATITAGGVMYGNGTGGVLVAQSNVATQALFATAGNPAFRAIAQADVPAMFTDRGDPATVDKSGAGFTQGAWTDWDLSAIVPAGATSVLLRVTFYCTSGAAQLSARKNGNSNAVNIAQSSVPVNTAGDTDLVVACDSGRVIEYYLLTGTYSSVTATVAGWWK